MKDRSGKASSQQERDTFSEMERYQDTPTHIYHISSVSVVKANRVRGIGKYFTLQFGFPSQESQTSRSLRQFGNIYTHSAGVLQPIRTAGADTVPHHAHCHGFHPSVQKLPSRQSLATNNTKKQSHGSFTTTEQ